MRRQRQNPPPPTPPVPRSREWWPAVLLVLAVILAYWPVYSAGYIWDDEDHLVRPGLMQSATGLWLIWFKLSATPQYYPLTSTTFWLEAQLWGLKPLGYHAVNVLLHAGGAVLLWRVLDRLKLKAALAIAAVWALHPVNVESVAWVSERKNVLSGVFYLSAMLCYVRFADADRPWGFYAASLGLYVAAVLSKSVTASLPAALILLLWWQGRMSRRHGLLLAPMFAFAIAMAFVTAGMEQWNVGAFGPPWELSFVDRCLIAGRAAWFYAYKLIWPATLMFNYPRWTIDPGQWWQWLFPLAAVLLLLGLWFARNRLGRGPLVAVLLFGGTLFPALGFINVYPHRFSFVADHFQYLAGIALLALVIESAARYLPRWGFVPVAVVLAALSFRYARAYHDVETIWQDTLAKNTDSWLAVTNLGAHYAAQGQDDRAEEHFRRSLAMHGDQIESHLFLAAVLERRGDLATAAEHYRAAQPIRSRDPRATYHLGRLARDRCDAAEAIRRFEDALAISPRYEPARLDLAELKQATGRPDEAVGHYERALQLNPWSVDARRKLAAMLFRGGYLNEAIDLLSQAETYGDRSAATANNLGVMLMQARRVKEAEAHFRRAVTADPSFAEARYNLGRSLEAQGDRGGAIASYKDALRLKPDLQGAREDLKRLSP